MSKKQPKKSPKQEALVSIKKATSLLQKINKMVEEDKYCIDIMQQNLSAIGLLKGANQKLLNGHLDNCVTKALKSKSPRLQKKVIREILQVSKLSNK